MGNFVIFLKKGRESVKNIPFGVWPSEENLPPKKFTGCSTLFLGIKLGRFITSSFQLPNNLGSFNSN